MALSEKDSRRIEALEMLTADSFLFWKEENVLAFMAKNKYRLPRNLPDGSWSAIADLMYTTSVCMDVTPLRAFSYRWCFEDRAEAEYFLATAQELDEVPERKASLKGHRYTTRPLYQEKDELGLDKW